MYALVRPLLFALPPEVAHQTAIGMLEALLTLPGLRAKLSSLWAGSSAQTARIYRGVSFPNPVGLAAGFDKDGLHIRALACLGFGFIEVGTVTPRPQAGNPKPRLFRLRADRALINRMGFNNAGVAALVARLERWRTRPSTAGPIPIVGANIGKNKDTPNKHAVDDYLYCFEQLFPWVDYFVVNVSSPNTPGLRALQAREPLLRLLEGLQNANRRQPRPKPLLLKIAPDLDEAELDQIVEAVLSSDIDGIVATNTTLSRDGLRTSPARLAAIGAGGLSGAPLRRRATEVLRYLRQCLGSERLLIGVGGIDSAAAAVERIQAGADLIQVYTGLIYRGPALVREVLAACSKAQ